MAVTACACAGQRSLAIKTLKDMKECGIHPDSTVYHAVLSACARSVLCIPILIRVLRCWHYAKTLTDIFTP
jgi:pentatricopeptide repeat protein